jgi:SOS-response transcriptional repressor LexA
MDAMKKSSPAPEYDQALGACSGAESFALMVLGNSMEPEFIEGEIIVIEPEGACQDGSFVLAFHDDEWIFRQLVKAENGQWLLSALNPAFPARTIADQACIKGVIIQKAKPGRRRASKFYV